MSQSWTNDVYASGHVGATDLQNMENNFACLKSLFSGASQPASMAACHPWFDTTKHVFKVRNDGDSAWVGLMHGDTSQKIWIYRNAAMSGWAVDSGVSDRVLAVKGGSTYTTGAAVAGTWTQPNHTHTGPSHSHTGPSHTHDMSVGATVSNKDTVYPIGPLSGSPTGTISSYCDGIGASRKPLNAITQAAGTGATGTNGTGATSGNATANTYRPAAAVGTLQYLNL